MKKVKELQQSIDENKYLLQQKGDSQSEASRKLEQFAQSLSSKQIGTGSGQIARIWCGSGVLAPLPLVYPHMRKRLHS